jgi:Domain of unknown function (DUF305)
MWRILKSTPGKAIFAARVLFAFALPPIAFAHDAHPPVSTAAASADEQAFLKDNEAAMTKMMDGMAAKPSGDIDRDFAAMMIPHHQGAIDMAVLELRDGKNEQLRRIAQEIIVDQLQEIAAMKLAIGEPADNTGPAPTQSTPRTAATPLTSHTGMQMNMSPATPK